MNWFYIHSLPFLGEGGGRAGGNRPISNNLISKLQIFPMVQKEI